MVMFAANKHRACYYSLCLYSHGVGRVGDDDY